MVVVVLGCLAGLSLVNADVYRSSRQDIVKRCCRYVLVAEVIADDLKGSQYFDGMVLYVIAKTDHLIIFCCPLDFYGCKSGDAERDAESSLLVLSITGCKL